METEMIDKLFLELAQVTNAKTYQQEMCERQNTELRAKVERYEKALKAIRDGGIQPILIAHEALKPSTAYGVK